MYVCDASLTVVHLDSQGFPPSLPDAHSIPFPVLALPPPSTVEPVSVRHSPEPPFSPYARVERFFHLLLALSSVPVGLLIPPYSSPTKQSPNQLQQMRIGRVALHPKLPIIAFSTANTGSSIFLFDLRTNAYLKYKLMLESTHELNTLVFSKYNLLAAGTSGGEVLIYELNLSISASSSPKTLRLPAIPSFASLIPPQFPSSSLLGEITDMSFDHVSARYMAIATTRSGTWVYDTIYSSSVRLSPKPSSVVAFSPDADVLAVARERTGEIEFYTMIRAGTLTFSLPTVVDSGSRSTVTNLHWTSDGKTFLFCNDDCEGIRILAVETHSIAPPGSSSNFHFNRLVVQFLGEIPTPMRATPSDGVPYGGNPTNFALDPTSRRIVVSYSKSPLLEAFAFSSAASVAEAHSLGLVRGPSTGKKLGEKAKGKLREGQSPYEEGSWEQAICVDMGFVGQALGDKGSLFAGAWNGEDGGKLAFVAFYLDDINM
jgi:hypothetical protein